METPSNFTRKALVIVFQTLFYSKHYCLMFVLTIAIAASQASHAEVLRFTVLDDEGEAVPGAVVELQMNAESVERYQEVRTVEIDQVDKEFVPELIVIPKGSEVSFPNSDEILHHVYSFSEIKEFNIPLYGEGEQEKFSEVFDVPGVAEIGCNIHDWMLAYIYVADTTKAGQTDAMGVVEIDMPPGVYHAKVWHSRLSRRHNQLGQEVEVVPGKSSEVSFTVQLTRDRRIRRAPSAGRSRYR